MSHGGPFFRIERQMLGATGEERAEARHRELMDALRNLGAETRPRNLYEPTEVYERKSETHIPEPAALKQELRRIYRAIEETKREIATLHQSGLERNRAGRVSDELAAVTLGTEQATEVILAAVEQIDQDANALVAAISDQPTQNLASDIQDQVVRIFEACNFQDLTGQRIAKVVDAFGVIEERVVNMMAIWGGAESFAGVEPSREPERSGDRALLNGPALENETGVASQADIDAMFA